jgi:antitoxin PrlF
MGRKAKTSAESKCCGTPISLSLDKCNLDKCKVEAMVSVDERGQMVLPKELREKAGIAPGDKMAVVSWMKDGEIYCITLIKADAMAGIVRNILGPLMTEIAPGK